MLDQLVEGLRAGLRRVGRDALATVGELWRLVRPSLFFSLQVLAALILLFEEWGWRPLVDALGRLASWRPWAALERTIAGLPPYAALAVLALPSATLFPLKFVALYLAAQGQVFAAGALFIAAKIASTALIGRFFLLTKPSLMRISWFAKVYETIVPWQQTMFAMIRESWPWRYGRMVKTRIRHEIRHAWTRWRPVIVERWRALRQTARRLAASLLPRLRLALRRSLDRLRGT